MFIGHFAAGFAAKTIAPKASLGSLFLAAQFLDLLWPTLLLLGVESVRIVPGATTVTPLVFEHYPISHSLLAVAGWAVLVGGAHFAIRRQLATALVLCGLVLSHWFLDALVHAPDLPLAPGGELRVGLSMWSLLPMTVAIEGGLFVAGVWLYARATKPTGAAGRWGLIGLVVLLAAIYAGNLFGPPPPAVEAIAWVGQSQWLLVAWGFWLDRHRRPGSAR